jgi:hypothetical protein
MLKAMADGLATFIPRVRHWFFKGTSGTDEARYCYSVWLRHLVMAARSGLSQTPSVVAELGPGDSLGIGLAALLSGAERYYAFDMVRHANCEGNLKVFDELVQLFSKRTDIPNQEEYPQIKPSLDCYRFPVHILGEEQVRKALDQRRIDSIRRALRGEPTQEVVVSYRVPWLKNTVVEPGSVDMIFSQAVLEHVDDLERTYLACHRWLKPGALMSHQIDFRCHGLAYNWNGHWTYTDWLWRLIRGTRPYFLNRQPYSTHRSLIEAARFEILLEQRISQHSPLKREELAPRFRALSDVDLTTSGWFVQARRA